MSKLIVMRFLLGSTALPCIILSLTNVQVYCYQCLVLRINHPQPCTSVHSTNTGWVYCTLHHMEAIKYFSQNGKTFQYHSTVI